jgi:hypothetical protein
MSITTIARQDQGLRAGQVIAKLAEDAYFMRVNTRVAQPPPVRNRDNEATSRSADAGRNHTRAELPANPNRTRATAGGPSQVGNSTAAADGDRAVVPHREPGGGGSDGGSSNHEANRRAGGGGDRGGDRGGRGHANSHALEPHRAATTPARRLRSYGARRLPRQATTTASPPSPRDFVTSSSQRNSSL